MDSSGPIFAAGMAAGCAAVAVAAQLSRSVRRHVPSNALVRAASEAEPALCSSEKDTLDKNQGGSQINTKEKTGKPAHEMSRLFYSLYGLENYPGYLLARHSEARKRKDDLEWLEATLAEKLQRVRHAQDASSAREQLLNTYVPKLTLPPAEEFINNTVLEGAKRPGVPMCMEEVADGVYAFDIFTPEVCEQILDQAKHFADWSNEQRAQDLPGSTDLNQNLCVVDHMGAFGNDLLDTLRDRVIDPLAKTLYPHVDVPDHKSDFRYGFIIGYSGDGHGSTNVSRKALDAHTDDAEITLTMCLGREYEGGEVVLKHLRSHPQELEDQTVIKMKPGQATLFLGQQIHQVLPVTSGERFIFVMWLRRSEYRAAHCPCCRMFVRERCLFGPEWN